MFKTILIACMLPIIIISCTPQGDQNKISHLLINKSDNTINTSEATSLENETTILNNDTAIEIIEQISVSDNINQNKVVNVVFSEEEKHQYIVKSFLNALEMATFDLNNESLTFKINYYKNEQELNEIFSQNLKFGNIFIGPISTLDTMSVKKYCQNNIIIFSFSSDRQLAQDCVYLFNFFIEDDLRKIFTYLNEENKVALLYPDNEYGNYVSSIIGNFANKSNATLIYKVSYMPDLSNSRIVIKQLGKYEFRKKELENQKKLLKERNDEISLASLKKLQKFETIGDLDFDSLIISDGNLRILELTPLLPFYDIDPKHVQFIGTGLWDERVFFDEPSLQGAIFPGVEKSKRKNFFSRYIELYNIPPPRTTTVMYDLAALVNYLLNTNRKISEIKSTLSDNNLFKGLDGEFSMKDNIVQRNLSMLKIYDGEAKLTN